VIQRIEKLRTENFLNRRERRDITPRTQRKGRGEFAPELGGQFATE